MQPQQRHDPVLPASDEKRGANKQPSMPKGVFSKVKQKASKIKEKVKKTGRTGDGTRSILVDNSTINDNGQQKTRPLFKSTVARDEAMGVNKSSSDDESMGKVNSQFKYEQLGSGGTFDDVQGDGSDVEHHDGVPTVPAHALGGSFWSRSDNRSPASDEKDNRYSDASQASPSEYHNHAASNKDDDTEGCNSGKPFTEKHSDLNQQYDGISVANRRPHDQIKQFSEDLSMDRKLGIGQDDSNTGYNDSREYDTPARNVNGLHPTRNPPPSPINGADEHMYKPVSEDNFTSSLTSESINAHLYGDVLPTEDRLSSKDKGIDHHGGNNDGNEFSFDTENSEIRKSQQCSRAIDNVAPDSEIGQDSISANRNRDGVERNGEGWGKWSKDNLNHVGDVFASKLGAADTEGKIQTAKRKEQNLAKTMSTDYFDPTDTNNHAFEEQLMLAAEDIGEGDSFMDTAMAGTAVIAETLNMLKDTVVSTLGYGSVAEDNDDKRNEDGDNEQQGAAEGINKEALSHVRPDAEYRHAPQQSEKPEDFQPEDFHYLTEREYPTEKGKADEQNSSSLERKEEKHGTTENTNKSVLSSDDSEADARKIEKPEINQYLTDSERQYQKTVKPERIDYLPETNSSSGNGKAGGNISHQWSLDSASDVPQAAFL